MRRKNDTFLGLVIGRVLLELEKECKIPLRRVSLAMYKREKKKNLFDKLLFHFNKKPTKPPLTLNIDRKEKECIIV